MNQCNRFRNATVLYFVFHQDKVDASFCGRMFHPPLLASNVFLFCLCLNRDIYSTCCYCDILLRYSKHLCFKSVLCSSTWMSHRWLCLILVELHKRRSDMCWYLFQVVLACYFKSWSRKVSTDFHPHDVQCALRCCATCFGTVLNKCWIEAIVLLSFPIK